MIKLFLENNKIRVSLLKCLFPFLFFFSSHSYSQEPAKSLVEILESIQERFPYIFTYADDKLEGIKLTPPPKNLSFVKILNYLSVNTNLIFTKIDDTYVSVKTIKEKIVYCGYILDYETKEPISEAVIKTGGYQFFTNEIGYFEIETHKINELVSIYYPGYTLKKKPTNTFKKKLCAPIYLEELSEFLPEVILVNYLAKGIDKTTDGNFKIDYTNFGILPGLIEPDVLQTIQALPGVQSADETVSNINIRGGTHDQNLIQWDGIKMYQSGHFFGLISMFDPNITKNATLIKNGTPSEYTDGVSGTILMKTDDSINQNTIMSIESNLINLSGFVSVPIGSKSSLELSGRKAISNFVKTPTYDRYFDRVFQNTEAEENEMGIINSDILFDFYDGSLKYIYDISDKDRIRLNLMATNNELEFVENEISVVSSNSRQSSLLQSNIAAGLNYQRIWNRKWKSELQLYETDYTLKAINEDILSEVQFFQENKVSETSAKLKASYSINEKLKLNTGYQWIQTGVTNANELRGTTFSEKRVEVINTHSLFAEVNYESDSKKTAIKVGLRETYNEKFDTHYLEPRFSYYRKLSSKLKLNISGEFKHQNTTHVINFQNDFLGVEKRRWELSNNETIPVIEGKQIGLGLHYNRNNFLISTEAYYKNISGIIARSQAFVNQYTFSNATGSYNVKGVDLLIKKEIKTFKFWASYAFAINEYDFESLNENIFPNTIDIRNAISLGGSYTVNYFKVATGINWKSGMPTTRPIPENEVVQNQINFEEPHSSRITPYWRWDISATYDFSLGEKAKIHTGVSLWNFFNAENILNEFYQLNNDNTINKNTKKSLMFVPNLHVKVSF